MKYHVLTCFDNITSHVFIVGSKHWFPGPLLHLLELLMESCFGDTQALRLGCRNCWHEHVHHVCKNGDIYLPLVSHTMYIYMYTIFIVHSCILMSHTMSIKNTDA